VLRDLFAVQTASLSPEIDIRFNWSINNRLTLLSF